MGVLEIEAGIHQLPYIHSHAQVLFARGHARHTAGYILSRGNVHGHVLTGAHCIISGQAHVHHHTHRRAHVTAHGGRGQAPIRGD